VIPAADVSQRAELAREPVEVVFMGGYSRSGSTLFDRMLGQIRGFTSTGEFGYLWTHGVEADRLCGCGLRFSECAFWRAVGQEAFGGWEQVDLAAMLSLQRDVDRHRYLPLLLFPWLSPSYAGKLRAYADSLGRVYRAIQRVSGARIVVDSTIDPAYGFVLRHVPGIDLRLVHFVRDSRGTAFSWTRRVERTDVVGDGVYMPRFHPAVTALRWTLYHLLMHGLGGLGVRAVRVRYEDVVRTPREQLSRAAAFLGEDLEGRVDMNAFRAGEFDLGTDHTVAGNRMRLQRGAVGVRVDDEWIEALPRRQRRIVTLLSWPLLRRYGYLESRPAKA
jgi:sulfotransferase family protein